MPSQYDTKTRAEVIADAKLGKPAQQIAEERNLPARTAQEWVHKAKADSRDPMLVDGEYRLAFQSQELCEDALQSLRDSGEPLHKYLVPLNIIRGTAIDKILKQPGTTVNTYGPTLIISEAAPSKVVEGVVIEEGAADDVERQRE